MLDTAFIEEKSPVADVSLDNIASQDEKKDVSSLEVNGFLFLTEPDAKRAQVDARKIEYLESHVKLNSVAGLEAVYKKAIQNGIFKTPLGWSYLFMLRQEIERQGGDVGKLPVIEMKENFTHLAPAPGDYIPKPSAPAKTSRDRKKHFLFYSVIINVILVVIVAGMFIIASTANSSTVLNYRENLLNEYSSWQKDLEEREEAVEKREKELGIESPPKHRSGNEQ
jgi:ABC-type Na+ efflux pump permease subunit